MNQLLLGVALFGEELDLREVVYGAKGRVQLFLVALFWWMGVIIRLDSKVAAEQQLGDDPAHIFIWLDLNKMHHYHHQLKIHTTTQLLHIDLADFSQLTCHFLLITAISPPI